MLIQPITGNQPQKASVTSGIKPLISTTQPVVTKQTTPSAPQVQEVQPKQKKSFLSGVGKFVARTAVNFADMITEGLDFSVNFVANNPIFTTKLTGQTATGGLGSYVTQKITKKQTPFQKQEGEIENKWRNLYAQASKEGKVPTANAKAFIDKIQDTEYIKPSEEWSKAPLKEKLTKKLGETLAVIGPSIIPSFVLYATNPILGVSTTITSTANDVQKQAEQNGVSRDKAEILGLGTGFLVGALDRIVPDELFGASAKNKFIGNLVKRIFTTSLKEAGTEIAQEDIQIAAEATFRKDLGWDEIKTRNVMSALGGLLGGAGASTVVGTVNNLTKENISVKDEQKVESKVEPNKREVIKLDKETYPGIESGMAIVRPDKTASLDVRFVKDAQGKGQGTKAVAELENRLVAKGITQVKIDSFSEAVGFWEKQGYKAVGEVKEGQNVPMVKELDKKTVEKKESVVEAGLYDAKFKTANDVAKYFEKQTGTPIQRAEVELGGWQMRGNKAEPIPYTPEQIKLIEKYNALKNPSSQYLFHTTPTSNLESIAKEGLVTGKPARFEGVSSPNQISLSANEASAQYYGGSNDTMIRISRKYAKTISDLKGDYLAGGEGIYTTGKNIPPEALEVKVNGKWQPLKNVAPQPLSSNKAGLYDAKDIVFVKNKNYSNEQAIRKLGINGESAFAIKKSDLPAFFKYAEKSGVPKSKWEIIPSEKANATALDYAKSNDYAVGFSDTKPQAEPFNPQKHLITMENGKAKYPYQVLLDRNVAQQPLSVPKTKSPQITAKEKVSPTPKEVTTPQAQKEVSPTDKFQSRVFERLKADNPKLEGDLTYDPIKLNEEARKAVNLISKDPQKAFDLAMGKEVSNEVTSTAVNIAMAEKALDEGNNELYAKLIKNRSLAQTRRGQELVSERGSIDDNSTSRYVKELISTRLNEVGKKYLSAITDKNVSDKERATKIVDRKVTDLELKISRKRLDTKTALKLLDSLECLT